ncbi:MAG: hypothetical protein JST00_23655 [Deltaproteobacteria bacterium]|nr:hypothetical protein [Deltaproteobacteria bacterium]
MSGRADSKPPPLRAERSVDRTRPGRGRERERVGGEHDDPSTPGPAELRLAIGKDGLGIELARPAVLACIDVAEVVVRLPHVKFPFDVSGGVAKFRHKRGELERLTLELDARRVARWAEPRLRGLLGGPPGKRAPGEGTPPCTVIVEPRAFGATITVHARTQVSLAAARGRLSALAFEVAVVPSQTDLAIIVHGARGAHLLEPATTLAIRAMAGLVGDEARREGSRFVIPDAAGKLGRALMPEAGVRAPGAEGVQLVGSGESDGVLLLAFVRDSVPPAQRPKATVPDEVTRAAEAAHLTREADDARVAGDLDLARQLDVAALERAPRHPEIARRIAEVDYVVGGRAEAASTTLREAREALARARPDHFLHTGLLEGELLLDTGDRAGAVASLLAGAERDHAAVVDALAYARAAELATDAGDALEWLDRAVARAPRVAELRWERARRRLAAGRLADARVDFQELEALAHGARDRHDVLRRAADTYREIGLGGDAAILYERALLYRPEDPLALAGLGAAIAGEGRAARGAAILAHAIELADKRGIPSAWMHLELGRVLGEVLGDRPAAVARLRAVPDDAPEAIAARGLEGRLRARLGDVAGASLAFARLRERAGREPSALAWLEEAARFEEERGDLAAAQRHLASAISIAPNDLVLEARYRALGEALARRAGVSLPREAAPPAPPAAVPEPVVPFAVTAPTPTLAPIPAPAPSAPVSLAAESTDDAGAEARVEALTRTLQGDPTNDAVVDELVVLLTRLGRSMDLLALLSARLEDAPAERRDALLPRHREVLATLEREARAAGRDAEAELFKLARETS